MGYDIVFDFLTIFLLESNFDDTSCKMLFQIGKDNTRLKELILGNNRISSIGCKYLSAWLVNHQNIEMIDLEDNNIDNEAIECLISLIQKNGNISRLLVNGDKFKSSYYEKIEKFLQFNKTYKEIKFQFKLTFEKNEDINFKFRSK